MSVAESSAGLADVAIVGMAGRFPGSPDVASLWQNVRNGVECIRFFTREELLESGVDPALAADPDYVPAHGWLAGIELFDAPFFDMSAGEAAITDPQFRFFLECAWQALEDAGIDPARHAGPIGVIAGASNNAYVIDNLLTNPQVIETMGGVQTALGNHSDFLSTRIAYKFDLSGPAITVQTACSTSLVAIHLACQSLLSGESDTVLAGGVCITTLTKRGYLHVDGGTNTSDGHVRAFDAKGDGMLGGNGVGVVVLKRLEDALLAGDTIRAVIKGSALNNDGAHKVSFTAPSVDGQAKVIMDALDVSGVEPETITMVEAHGTATPLGDPIEIRALTQAWRSRTDVRGNCAIGSAKTNFGHLDIAAGVTGVIKAALSLEHKEIPPSLHFEKPNPEIDFASSPFFVNTKLRPWESGGLPRRAAVSSFGMGGTNAHAILEEAPESAARASDPRRDWQLFTLAAKSDSALERMPARLAQHLESHPELSLADAAYTLHVGRAAFPLRRAVVARGRDEAIDALRKLDARRATPPMRADARRPVAFLFSGQGAQYPNMARGLHANEPLFRSELERVLELFEPHVQVPGTAGLQDLLFPDKGAEQDAARQLGLTQFTQPALFAVEYALARLWQDMGVEPEAMLGHSIGEYVAATLAEVFSLEDACRLVALRGRLIGSLPAGGGMLAVHAEEAEIQGKLGGSLSIAASNAPGLVVVSGPEGELAQLESRLDGAGIGTRQLHTSHAFHSSLMDPILDAFRREVEATSLAAPKRPLVSCTSGTWLSDEEARDPQYWVRHLRRPVRFAAGVATLAADPGRVLLEVGPGETLASLARLSAPQAVVVASTRHPKESAGARADVEVLLRASGELWAAGVDIDWDAFHAGEERRRIPLPTYPFDRERHWVEAGTGIPGAVGETTASAPSPLHEREADLADWFHVPTWQETPAPLSFPRSESPERPWLVFMDEGGLGQSVAGAIETGGSRAIRVHANHGRAFERRVDGFAIDPGTKAHYRELFQALDASGEALGAIAFCFGADPLPAGDALAAARARCFFGPLFLAQELAERERERELPVGIVTSAMQSVHQETPARATEAGKALVVGPVKSMGYELERVACRSIDVDPRAAAEGERFAQHLFDELRCDSRDRFVHLDGERRWSLSSTPVRLGPCASPTIRKAGTYLVTGGLGGIGLTLAEELVRRGATQLILLGRSELPAAETWDALLSDGTPDEDTARKLRGVRRLQELGAEVMTARAVADDEEAMGAVLGAARQRFGRIHGVIHAAGVVGAGVLAIKSVEDAERVFAPKLDGTDLLRRLFADEPLELLVLVSSIATAPRVFAGVDYASANAYLDATARAWNHVDGTRVLATSWDTWRDVGIATHARVPDSMRAQHAESMRLAIAPDEGREALARLLGSGLSQVYVTPVDLSRRDDFARRSAAQPDPGASERPAERAAPTPARAQPRPELTTAFAEPQSETETAVAALWSELLGVAPIGRDDSFFELGGNSLVMMQLNVRLRSVFGVSLPIRDLFDAPQVVALADRIESIQAVSQAADDESSEEIEEFTL